MNERGSGARRAAHNRIQFRVAQLIANPAFRENSPRIRHESPLQIPVRCDERPKFLVFHGCWPQRVAYRTAERLNV